jgi:hypothetical protein
MMARTHQHGVVDVRAPADLPRDHVVGMGTADIDAALGERAVAVSAFERAAQPDRNDAPLAPDVEDVVLVGVEPGR